MTVSPERVKELQFFLMDAAKTKVGSRGDGLSTAGGLLSSAAALDYVLLLASERPDDMLDTEGPVAAGVRGTMTRAALAALDFTQRLLAAPPEVFNDFNERHLKPGGIFGTLRALAAAGAFEANDVSFELVTTASDVLERVRR